MNPRKREASDTLSTRRHKQPRLALKGYGGGTPSPSEKEGLLSRWNRFRMEFVSLSTDTLALFLSKITLREPCDPGEPESLISSNSSTPQQISSPAVRLVHDGSTDIADYSTPSRTVLPSCSATIPQAKLMVQPATPRPNGSILTDVNGRLRNLAEPTPGQVTPTPIINRMPNPSTPSKGASLKSQRDTGAPEYRHRQSFIYGRPEDSDLPSTSRTTSHSLLKESPFPPTDSSLTSWSSKDDLSDLTKSLQLGSPSSLESSQRFRFSTTSPNSHPQPDSHIPLSRKSSIAMRRGTSGQYNRRRPHIHEKVHKANVQRVRLQIREQLKKEYNSKRRSGYTSSFVDFLGYTDYKKTIQDLDLDIASYPPFSKPLQGDLKLKSPTHSARRLFEEPENPVQRALNNANATLNGPKPAKPYIPNLDQLHISHRTKDDEIERRIRPPVAPSPSCLPPADEARVSAILLQDGVISKFAREQVSDQDIARLLPGQWLNDEVINFYGAMILARSEGSKENPGSQRNGKMTKKATFLNAHYFSSFFWPKLTKEGYENGRLAKWTKKIDIFSKDIILIPVNHSNSHWTAAAINFKKKRVESYDSMGIAKEKVFTNLRSYINAEHMNKRKKPFDFTDWENWAPDTTPQQENGYDCGVFTCQFLETLSRGEESFRFSQKNMPYLRRRMIWEIGNAKLRDD